MEWISVEDELPEMKYKDYKVLCICKVKPTPRDKDLGCRTHIDYRISLIPMGTQDFIVRRKEHQMFYDIKVTHWMPLPEPPK